MVPWFTLFISKIWIQEFLVVPMRVVKVYIFIRTHETNPLRVPPMLRGFVFVFGVQGRPPDQVEADPETARSCKMSDETKRWVTVGHSPEEQASMLKQIVEDGGRNDKGSLLSPGTHNVF